MAVLNSSKTATQSLYDLLAAKLPSSTKFTFHHISTPPTKCDPLYAPPPGTKPERTYCESHFLTVSAPQNTRLVLLFAIEVLIFTTKYLTTVFISKADSTGCLASRHLPSSSSIIRSTTSTFVSYLVSTRQRPRTRLVLSLFARAQGQYLFPASVDNKGKHVLDDRQLVKWWCKTLDPVLRSSPSSTQQRQAFVLVPGFDRQETIAFLPPSYRTDPPDGRKWTHGHPLELIARNPAAPPRCLVPRFPDDPKARYLDELDEELPDAGGVRHVSSPSKRGSGVWKSIKTLSQFWEMMAFRQECSSGRLVGFVWVVFTPEDLADGEAEEGLLESPGSIDRRGEVASIAEVVGGGVNRDRSGERSKKPLSGPVIARAPRVKRDSSTISTAALLAENSPFWKWPEDSRGQVVVDPAGYDRIHDLLLKLDFSSDEAATESTAKWLEEAVTIFGDSKKWGREVTGQAEVTASTANGHANGTAGPVVKNQPHDLSASIVRKKRKAENPPDPPPRPDIPPVNVLSSGFIRKRPKT
ncbi:hypothetical protein K461DRAFT_267947 [Myriangium duriaei CBS 260.36]|uniref:histone acetyltransferase n=1 Tax=Myriangium duriaei CBS 260.36 TaxID=1168546 RepID=A0A9P4J4M0_9PEZI|nr:hypothetical protein K461DRAFT_267947 [Myriangium duriaei CBS 260.36]